MLVTNKRYDSDQVIQSDINKEHTKELETIKSVMDAQAKVIQNLIASNGVLINKVDELYGIRKKLNSDEPWIDVIGGNIDPEKGLEMKLDWNDAFIDQLRSNGFKGTSESSLVGQYLLMVSETVAPEGEDQ